MVHLPVLSLFLMECGDAVSFASVVIVTQVV